MTVNKLAQGAFARFKITVPGQDLSAANQVQCFIYDQSGRILKQFAREAQSMYSPLKMVDGNNAAFTIDILPTDTKNVKEGFFYADVRIYKEVESIERPFASPSFQDENKIFELCKSITKDKVSE